MKDTQMAISMKEDFSMVKLMDTDIINGRMMKSMMVNGKWE